jgi:hypothetical protein
MSQSQEQSSLGRWIVIGFYFILCLYLLPANLFWYVLTLVGWREPYFNGIIEALVCPWTLDRAFHPLSWGPFLFDCVFSGIAWLGILKVCGVKL